MEYALEDLIDLVLEFFPNEFSYDLFDKLGCPDDMDIMPMKAYFQKFREQFSAMYSQIEESFLYERQHMQVCQSKGPDFLRLYMGNSQMTEYTVKRTDFWEKVQNRKENQEKAKANKTKSQNNFNNGQQRKNGSFGRGKNDSGQKGNDHRSNSNNFNNNNSYNGNGYQGNKGYGRGGGNNNNNNHFSPKKCPDCLGPTHGNFPCPKQN